jgi:hypothetical protein
VDDLKFKEYLELTNELKIPTTFAHYQVDVFSPDDIIKESIKDRSHSYVRNGYNLLTIMSTQIQDEVESTFGPGSLKMKSFSTSLYYQTWTQSFMFSDTYATAGRDWSGIIVGTSNTVEDFEAYILGTRVLHGTGSGQLSYQAQTGSGPTYDSGTKTWTKTYSRFFNNNSSGTININELGMCYSGMESYSDPAWTALMIRDVLPAPVEVLNLYRLKVTYEFSMVFPA